MFTIKLFLIGLTKKMWPKVSFFAFLAVVSALGALLLRDIIPPELAKNAGSYNVEKILTILASSMLAVTTFSLSTMLAAYNSASSSVTPRATQLLMQDGTTQNVLATFLGSFLFSLVGIIAISTGIYDRGGRFVLFLMSLGVIALILVTLIRWIERIMKLGRMGETTKTIEDVATKAMRTRAEDPCLGAVPLGTEHAALLAKMALTPVFALEYGYVQYIDVDKLGSLAQKHAWRLYVVRLPGSFVGPDAPLVRIDGEVSEGDDEHVRDAFVFGDERVYDQDPRFGLCVLSEVAMRALSPAVNDPGTAIDVIGRLVRVLAIYAGAKPSEPAHPEVWLRRLAVNDMFQDAFGPLPACCENLFDVQSRLLKALRSLHSVSDPAFKASAAHYSRQILLRVERSTLLEEEKAILRQLALPQ